MKKYLIPITLSILVTIIVALSATTYFLYRGGAANLAGAQAPVGNASAEGEAPTRIKIPSLNIDADVEAVGRDSNGAMANPSTFHDVAWFTPGGWAGAKGSVAMAGHVDNALGLDGVFKNLDEIKVGDEVLVTTASSTELRYRVIGMKEYHYEQVPLYEVFDKDDGAYLNLITCGGNWLSAERTYDKRLIVYTELVE